MNSLETTLKQTLISPSTDNLWYEAWDQSQDSVNLRCTDPNYVDQTCRRMGMGEATRQRLIEGLAALTVVPQLKRLLEHGCFKLYQQPLTFAERRAAIFHCPVVSPQVHPAAPLLQAYMVLEGVSDAIDKQEANGWSQRIIRDTWFDLELWIRRYHQRHGIYGLDRLPWLINHLNHTLVRIGRLEYMPTTLDVPFRAFRHSTSRKVIFVADAGLRFRTDGQYDGADGVNDPEAWTSVYEQRGNTLRANVYAPTGYMPREPITLALNKWQPIFQTGDMTLGIHIPADGSMDFAACGESLREALDFFPKHMPEGASRVFSCFSWLCDPQFGELMSETSNIRRFQSQFYLLPSRGAKETSMFMQLFGRTFDNLDDMPQDNSLFRLIADHKRRGGCWRNAGAMLFADDLDWGGPGYRED